MSEYKVLLSTISATLSKESMFSWLHGLVSSLVHVQCFRRVHLIQIQGVGSVHLVQIQGFRRSHFIRRSQPAEVSQLPGMVLDHLACETHSSCQQGSIVPFPRPFPSNGLHSRVRSRPHLSLGTLHGQEGHAHDKHGHLHRSRVATDAFRLRFGSERDAHVRVSSAKIRKK